MFLGLVLMSVSATAQIGKKYQCQLGNEGDEYFYALTLAAKDYVSIEMLGDKTVVNFRADEKCKVVTGADSQTRPLIGFSCVGTSTSETCAQALGKLDCLFVPAWSLVEIEGFSPTVYLTDSKAASIAEFMGSLVTLRCGK